MAVSDHDHGGEPSPDPAFIATPKDFSHALVLLRRRPGPSIRNVARDLRQRPSGQVSVATLGGWFGGRHLPTPKLDPVLFELLAGSGKSSLLQAGLIPGLSRPDSPLYGTWRHVSLTLGERPVRELAHRIAGLVGRAPESLHQELMERAPTSAFRPARSAAGAQSCRTPSSWWGPCRRRSSARRSPSRPSDTGSRSNRLWPRSCCTTCRRPTHGRDERGRRASAAVPRVTGDVRQDHRPDPGRTSTAPDGRAGSAHRSGRRASSSSP